MKTTGHYYRSRKEYEQRTGKSSKYIQNNPSIHISGSVRGCLLYTSGHDAVADFIGTDVSSDSYERLLDETEAQMPSEEFEKFWERYI